MENIKLFIRKNINKIFIAVIVLTFVAISSAAAFLGVDIYSIVSHKNMTFSDSPVSYIKEKVLKCEDKSNLRTASVGGTVSALVISTEKNGTKTYDTWLFAHDGYLKEVTAYSDDHISVSSGKKIFPLDGIDFSMPSSSLLEIDMTNEYGTSISWCINLYGTGGANDD